MWCGCLLLFCIFFLYFSTSSEPCRNKHKECTKIATQALLERKTKETKTQSNKVNKIKEKHTLQADAFNLYLCCFPNSLQIPDSSLVRLMKNFHKSGSNYYRQQKRQRKQKQCRNSKRKNKRMSKHCGQCWLWVTKYTSIYWMWS